MDEQLFSYFAFAMSVLSIIIGAINHKRIRSTCCGKNITSSIDIESTSPIKPPPEIK